MQGRESDRLDYKETFTKSNESWLKIIKDVFAFANFGEDTLFLELKTEISLLLEWKTHSISTLQSGPKK